MRNKELLLKIEKGLEAFARREMYGVNCPLPSNSSKERDPKLEEFINQELKCIQEKVEEMNKFLELVNKNPLSQEEIEQIERMIKQAEQENEGKTSESQPGQE